MKSKSKQVLLFVLGVIATLIITSMYNKIFPSDPTVVKEVTDSLTVVHKYNFPATDSMNLEIKNRLENIELLNSYENEIEERIKRIEKKSNQNRIPNLIYVNPPFKIKGWIQRKASSFFSLECPTNTNTQYLDFEVNFLNKKLIEDIASLRVLVYKLNSKGETSIYLDDYYETVNNSMNLIRLNNDFENGKYEINIGIILKDDLKNEYPIFYRQKCNFKK